MLAFVFVHQQRDSGDDEDMDKNSEDEEGQLEEQIERLQEKVESAQSEQKNLFLVIFQVLKAKTQTRTVGFYNVSAQFPRTVEQILQVKVKNGRPSAAAMDEDIRSV